MLRAQDRKKGGDDWEDEAGVDPDAVRSRSGGCRAEGGSTRGGDTAVPGERLMSVGQGCQRWWDVVAQLIWWE